MAEAKDSGGTEESQEQKTIKRTIPIKGNPWKPSQITGYKEVTSGPLPTHEELPPVDPETGKPVGIQKDFMDKVDNKGKTQEPPSEE